MKSKVITIFIATLLALLTGAGTAFAFIGPGSLSAGTGGGTLQLDASGNIGFGTAAPTPTGNANEALFGRIFTIASSSDPGISLKNLSAGGHSYTMYSRGNGRLAIWDDTVGAVRLFIEPSGRIAIGATSSLISALTSTLQVYGNISATNGISGDIYPSSIIGGAFQATNYAFPSQLAVGTTTVGVLPTLLYVNGTSTLGTINLLSGSKIQDATNQAKYILFEDGSGYTTLQQYSGYNFTGFDAAAYSSLLKLTATNNWSSAINVPILMTPTIRQSGTAGYTGLRLNVTEATTGSGPKLIQDWEVGGISKMVIDNTGNLGIGTTTPSSTLSVVGTTTITTGNLKIATNGYGVVFPDGTTQTSAASGGYWSASSTNIYNNTGGYVGIGTSNPSELLTVNSITGRSLVAWQASGTNRGWVGDSNPLFAVGSNFGVLSATNLYFGTGGASMIRMAIDTTGNVGIGTSTPTNNLEIQSPTSPQIRFRKNTGTPDVNYWDIGVGSAASFFVLKDTSNALEVIALQSGGGYTQKNQFGTVMSVSNGDRNVNFVTGSGGNVGIGTSTPVTAKLVITPVTGPSIDAGGQKIVGLATPTSNNDAANKTYVDSVVAGAGYWAPGTGGNIYNSNAGWVGIGTTTPISTLHVVGTSTITGNLNVSGTINGTFTGTNSGATLASSVRGNGGIFGNSFDFWGTNYRFNDATNTVLLQIDATNGRIGVGTISPSAKLDIFGTNNGLRLSYDAANYANIVAGNTGSIFFQPKSGLTYFNGSGVNNRFFAYDYATDPGGTTYLGLSAHDLFFTTPAGMNTRIADSGNNYFNGGNVGIGTSTPDVKLQVMGDIKIGQPNVSGGSAGRLSIQGSSNVTALSVGTGQVGSDLFAIVPGSPSVYSTQLKTLSTVGGLSLTNNINSGIYIPNSGDVGSGNVGIGTSTPRAKLDVMGGIMQIGGTQFQITNLWGSSGFQIIGGDGAPNYIGTMGINEPLLIRTNSLERMRIDASGNIGIGTTTPISILHVVGTSTITGNLNVTGNITGTFTGTNSGATLASSVLGATFGSSFQNGTNYRFNDATNTALLMIDAGNGRIGVGTASPSYKFEIAGAAGTGGVARIGSIDYGTAQVLSIAPGTVYFDAPGTVGGRMTILGSNGNVGVGTAAPGYKLDVAGGIVRQSGYLVADAATNNLLVNGDFEMGNTFGWSGFDLATTSFAYSGAYAAQKTGSATVLSDDYIPVNPVTDVLQLEGQFMKPVAGTTPGVLFFGYIAYNANKVAITTAPCGTYCYFAASSYTVPVDGGWHKFSATTNGEGTAYPKFPIGTKYVRVLMLINYTSSADAVTVVDHVQLRKINNGPLFVGNSFDATNMLDQTQMTKLYTTAGNNFVIAPPSGGNVGIGTASPGAKLDVSATSKTEAIRLTSGGYINFGATNDGPPSATDMSGAKIVFWQGTTSSQASYAIGEEAGNMWFNTQGGYKWYLGGSSAGMVLNTSNNLGIGTATATTARVVIVPGGQPAIDAGSQRIINVAVPVSNNDVANKTYVDSAILTATSSGTWVTNGANIYNGNTGNVGVGSSTAPLYKFSVFGSMSADSGNIFSDGAGNLNAISFYDKASPAYYLQPSGAISLKTVGNVMLGGAGTPLAKLDIQNGDSSTAINGGISQIALSYGAGGFRHFLQTRHNVAADDGNALVLWLNTSSTAGASSAAGTGNVKAFDFGVNTEMFYTAGTERMRINSTGNIGIGTTAPGANLLYVNGATLINGTLNMNGNNISSVGKLTVTTVDPLYDIGGKKYATYAASIAGGVKEEYIGRARLADARMTNDKGQITNDSGKLEIGNWKFVIDLAAEPQGSDLWVWYHAVDFSSDNVEVFATPSGGKASIWYEINGTKITFNGDASVNFSYRLVGKRHDWKDWPTFAKNQNEQASFTIKGK